MGSTLKRPRADGTIAYLAKVAIMEKGKPFRESWTFDRRPAGDWIEKRERELAVPGAIERARAAQNDPPLSVAIDRYIAESEKVMGKTKALRTIKTYGARPSMKSTSSWSISGWSNGAGRFRSRCRRSSHSRSSRRVGRKKSAE
jgi:hypothetical protein